MPIRKYSHFMLVDTISVELTAKPNWDAIKDITESFASADSFVRHNQAQIEKLMTDRQKILPTCIGKGFAVLYTKVAGLPRQIGTIAISAHAIGFESDSFAPVHVIFGLISSNDQPSQHIQALELICRSLRDDHFSSALIKAKTVQNIVKVLDDYDSS